MPKAYLLLLMICYLHLGICYSHHNHSLPRFSSRLVRAGRSRSAARDLAAEKCSDFFETEGKKLGEGYANRRYPDGSTPLHRAAKLGDLRMVKFLVDDTSVLLNVKDNLMFTPLVLAERHGHEEITSLLRAAIGDVRATRLVEAAVKGDACEVVSLLRRGADVNGRETEVEMTALHKAARYDFMEIAKFLVKHGADLTLRANNGQTPLFEAAYYGQLNMATYLVESGSELNTIGIGMTPAQAAKSNGHQDVAAYLQSVGGRL